MQRIEIGRVEPSHHSQTWTRALLQNAPGALAQCKEDGVKYFLEKFQRLPLKFRTEGEVPKEIFTHVTTAINTDNARKVLGKLGKRMKRANGARAARYIAPGYTLVV